MKLLKIYRHHRFLPFIVTAILTTAVGLQAWHTPKAAPVGEVNITPQLGKVWGDSSGWQQQTPPISDPYKAFVKHTDGWGTLLQTLIPSKSLYPWVKRSLELGGFCLVLLMLQKNYHRAHRKARKHCQDQLDALNNTSSPFSLAQPRRLLRQFSEYLKRLKHVYTNILRGDNIQKLTYKDRIALYLLALDLLKWKEKSLCNSNMCCNVKVEIHNRRVQKAINGIHKLLVFMQTSPYPDIANGQLDFNYNTNKFIIKPAPDASETLDKTEDSLYHKMSPEAPILPDTWDSLEGIIQHHHQMNNNITLKIRNEDDSKQDEIETNNGYYL
ncbi:MAG: hypothetical protein ACPGC9_01230, partial [Cytophagales bacterium]